MKEAIKALGYDYEHQEKTYVNSCNLCGCSTLTLITHTDRYGYAASTTSCTQCSLTFLNPQMTKEGYAVFYQRVYRPLISAFYGRLYDEMTIQGMQHEYAEDRARFLVPYFSRYLRGSKMLDVGGSTGVVAKVFRERFNLEPTIIDPAPLEVAQAKAMGLETMTGFVEDFEGNDESFDFIGMFQTIDHLLDVSKVFNKIHALLRVEGLFFVDIVDFRAAYLRNRSVEKATKIDHPYSFTDSTARLYLKKYGFEILGMEYSADHLHVGYICRKSNPADVEPNQGKVDSFFEEVRKIQNSFN